MPSTALSLTALPSGLVALPGVYQPQADTRLLAAALADEDLGPRTEVLEIGTGTGALALHAAARGAQVTAVDVSWTAVATARLNAWRHRLPLRVLHGDFEARTTGRRFDVVFSNPRTSPPRTTDRPRAGRNGPGTPVSTGARSSTGSAPTPRPCCGPAESCSWCTRRCAAPRRPWTGWRGQGWPLRSGRPSPCHGARSYGRDGPGWNSRAWRPEPKNGKSWWSSVPSGPEPTPYPVLVRCPAEIVLDDGTTARSDRFLVAVCTCRRSRTNPWCDTGHRGRSRAASAPENRNPA